MITISQYRRVMTSLADKGILSRTIDSLQVNNAENGGFFIKHDVEDRIERAITLAQIEAQIGHRATYYFQGDLIAGEAGRKAAQEVAALGHEVSYHYDVLDAADGDYEVALEEFAHYLAIFADMGTPVRTVCPHGNPTKLRHGWRSNKDFFRSPIVRTQYPDILDIVVDFPLLCPEGVYISDAGFQLRVIGHIASNDQSNDTAIQDGRPITWSDLAAIVTDAECTVLSIHPHRLDHNVMRLIGRRAVFSVLKAAYTQVKAIPFMRQMASRFYHHTRRF